MRPSASSRAERWMTATGTSLPDGPRQTTRAGAASIPARAASFRASTSPRVTLRLSPTLANLPIATLAPARELADGKPAVLVHQRAFGPHAAQRRALALQIAQVFGGLLAALHCAAGLEDSFQFDQRRRVAAAGLYRAVPS